MLQLVDTWLPIILTPTWVHTTLSIIALLSGFVVLRDLLTSTAPDAWTTTFIVSSIATSATGFAFFPITPFLESHVTGVVALLVLAIALIAAYGFHSKGPWRIVYAVSLVVTQFFNVLVAIVQAFRKVPQLNALAPTQKELPFIITGGIVLALFLVLAILAGSYYRYEPMMKKAA
jgi:hypothetical protein